MPRTPLILVLILFLTTLFPRPVTAQSGSDEDQLEGLPVRDLVVSGLQRLDEDVVRRRLELKVGGPWRRATARRDEHAVAALALFWSVRIRPEPVGGPGRPDGVMVHVELEERFTWFGFPQIAWTPEEGWSYGIAGGHLNVAGRGHRLLTTLMTGGARYLSLSLSNPWSGPGHEHFHLGGALQQAENRLYDFEETGERLNAEWGRWLGRTGRLGLGVGYRRVRSDRPGITVGSDDEDLMHSAWFNLGFDTADPWSWPRLGTAGGLRVEGSGGLLGGEVTDRTVSLRLDTRQALSPRWVLAGLVSSDRRTGPIPFWHLLALGGPFSVRGYPLGHYLVTERQEASLELRWYLSPLQARPIPGMGTPILGISLALFGDLGRGDGIRRDPGGGLASGPTPTLSSWGLTLVFHSADLGGLGLEYARPDGAPSRWLLRLGTRF
jgi:outer membrane protein assembly factor BamA